jgi:hypothetical protein
MTHLSFKIKEDVCDANKKDRNATELLKAMSHYGEIEPFETAVAKVRAEYQIMIDNLTKQLDNIKEQELTDDEMVIVRSYRSAKNAVVSKYTAENESLKESLRKADEKAKDMSRKICETLEAYATE